MTGPLYAILAALVDGVDAHEAGAALGMGFAPLADVDPHRARLILGAAATLVGLRLTQVVEVAVGDGGQALIAAVAEQLPGSLAELAVGRSGEGAVQGGELNQSVAGHPRGCSAGEGPGRGTPRRGPQDTAVIADTPALAELGDDLPSACGGCWRGSPVTLHRYWPIKPLPALPRRQVAETVQGLGDEVISGLRLLDIEAEGLAAVEKPLDLLKSLESLGLESHDDPLIIPTPARSAIGGQTHLWLETRPRSDPCVDMRGCAW